MEATTMAVHSIIPSSSTKTGDFHRETHDFFAAMVGLALSPSLGLAQSQPGQTATLMSPQDQEALRSPIEKIQMQPTLSFNSGNQEIKAELSAIRELLEKQLKILEIMCERDAGDEDAVPCPKKPLKGEN